MRFLIDENVPFMLLSALQERRHDALHVATIDQRAGDPDVLDRACREQRILISFDSDFSRMIFHEGKRAPPGVVYMRSRPANARLVVERFVAALDAGPLALDGKFLVIDEGSAIRILTLDHR